MTRFKRLFSRAQRLALNLPVLGVLLRAARNYVLHQSGNQAGSMAFSMVLSMFPLLLLLSAAAPYLGAPGDAAALARRVAEYAPPLVRGAIQPVIDQVLSRRSQSLLAIGLFVTLWTASSGIQAARTALNRSYGIQRGLSFWQARLKVTLFTLVVGAGALVTFSSVVVMPYVWHALSQGLGEASDSMWLRQGVRYAAALPAVAGLYALLYAWLPDISQRVRTVLPGALVGAALWVASAVLLSRTLAGAGKLALLYGSFAGVVATLVFLYISAATLIYGAEVNAVIRERLQEPP